MMKKLQGTALLLCTLSYAAASTVAIGTASARGDMRVDRYTVNGNATLFDGSVVETGQATADLRLDKGVQITMSTKSRGTLYHDHLVLEQGASELTSSGSFQVSANNLRVAPIGTDSRAVVTLTQGKAVEVSALKGSIGVTSDQGVLLARVLPGQPMMFAPAAGVGAGSPQAFVGTGVLSKGADGNDYLAVGAAKYEINGSGLDKYVGETVTINGTSNPTATPAGGASLVVDGASAAQSGGGSGSGGGGLSNGAVIIGGIAIAAAVGAGIGIWVANNPLSPVSRP